MQKKNEEMNVHLIFKMTEKRVFDLLKNEGLDRTTLVLQYLICKIVLKTKQTRAKEKTETEILVSHNHNTIFCLIYQLFKIPK